MGVKAEDVQRFEYNGKMLTVHELADLANTSVANMHYRLKRMFPEEAVVYQADNATYYKTLDGKITLFELSKRAGMHYKTLQRQLDKMTIEEITKIARQPIINNLSEEETEELFDYKGKLLNVEQLAMIAKCSKREMNRRLDTYKTIEECIRG